MYMYTIYYKAYFYASSLKGRPGSSSIKLDCPTINLSTSGTDK